VAPLQLGLGDSWAWGFGASDRSTEGYVPQLHEVLRERFNCSGAGPDQAHAGCPHLGLLNLAIPGATTKERPPSLIGNQFPQAIPLLESRNLNGNPRDDVEVTTLHTGGNDIFQPIIAACGGGFSPTCQQTIAFEFGQYQADLTEALSTLRSAAGDATIVIGTYDNPFRYTPCTSLSGIPGIDLFGQVVLEGDPLLPFGLHDIMRTVAANYGVKVADVHNDLNDPPDWLSFTNAADCLHPSDSGYDKVTDAFVEAVLEP
jgi:lysophospholipase L1-like esterase